MDVPSYKSTPVPSVIALTQYILFADERSLQMNAPTLDFPRIDKSLLIGAVFGIKSTNEPVLPMVSDFSRHPRG